MPADLPIFTPSPEIIPKILDDLCDADLTLRDIAQKAQTTVEALSLWLATPDIAARITLIQSTIAQRTRLAATCLLPGAVRTVNRIVDEYNEEESHIPIKPGSLMGHEYRRRSRESARRACNLLLRLARFHHEPCHGLGRPSGHARADAGASPSVSVNLLPPRRPAPTLEDLRTHVENLAPAQTALRGVARTAAPAPGTDDVPPAPELRAPASSPVSRQAVEVPVPQLALTPPPSPVIHSNGNGHPRPTSHEHWP